MNRAIFTGALSVLVMVGAGWSVLAEPKLNRAPGIVDTGIEELDFGDLEVFGTETLVAPFVGPPDSASAGDDEGLAGLALLILRALNRDDPDQLSGLSDALRDKVPTITDGSAALDVSEAIEIIQLYTTLASGGYVLDLTEPLSAVPIPSIALEPLIIAPAPMVVEPLELPPPLIAFPAPSDVPDFSSGPPYPPLPDAGPAERNSRNGPSNAPLIRVGRGDTYDEQFDRFFSLSFGPASSERRLRLEVDRAGHLAMRAFYDPDVINWVRYEVRSDANEQWTLGRDGLIWVQPGRYDVVVRLNDRSIVGNISLRFEIRYPLDKTEPNNSLEQAVPIELPFRQKIFLEANDDIDWFSFTIGEEGVLSAALSNAALEVYGPDGKVRSLPDTQSGTRYLIVQPGGYHLKVRRYSNEQVNQVTLRHYPPSDFAAEINRIIGVGLENDPETAEQMRAVSYATGVPLVETTDVAEITAALKEASGTGLGTLWWLWGGMIVALLIAVGAYFLKRKNSV